MLEAVRTVVMPFITDTMVITRDTAVLEAIKTVAHYVAVGAEGVAVFFILSGMIGSVVIYVKRTYFIRTDPAAYSASRNHLAHSLSLSLEFLIGADVLRTAILPTWQDIGQLAAIVGIRTVLNFFLSRELHHM